MFESFKAAQNARFGGFETAVDELRHGRKTSHWIWYIFPQLAGLGTSGTAKKYALPDVRTAMDYLRDPVLGSRLAAATRIVADQVGQGVPLRDLMGGELDARKLVSSLTLFDAAAAGLAKADVRPELSAFRAAARAALTEAAAQGFPRCAFTLHHVEGEWGRAG